MRQTMLWRFWAVALIAGLALCFLLVHFAVAAPDYTAWNDLGIVYTAPSGGAYYPSVLYDANGFGGSSPLYKMWYSDGSGGVFVVTSGDGITWGARSTVAGLPSGAHHVQVLYDPGCFGGCGSPALGYRIWYWTGNMTYSIADMETAQSSDGVNWTARTAITQSATAPLVTGAGSGWNRGTYGPVYLFYQPGASNRDQEPWNYSYVMYYDGTDGSSEVTGLAYSADGLYWAAYSSSPVLDKGSGPAWDCDDSVYGTVYHNASGYHFWYSGGGGDNGSGTCAKGDPVHEGIGYASSTDGITWTKDAGNPIFHFSDGVSYRNQRVYTPAVVDNGSGILRMYYSAVGADGIKKIGLAVTAPETAFVDDDWIGLTLGAQVTFPGDPNPHFIGIDAFDTIQKGINAVTAGGTVKVAAGTYNITAKINVNKAVTIRGPQAGVDPRPAQSTSRTPGSANEAIIDGGGSLAILVDILADDVTLDGLEARNGSGDLVNAPASPIHYRPAIRNMIIHNSSGDEGIQIRNVNNAVIEKNYVYSTVGDGINICDSSDAGTSVIQDNEIHDSRSEFGGIYVYGNNQMRIQRNLIVHSDAGIAIGRNGSSASPNTIVDSNVIDGATGTGGWGGHGIRVYNSNNTQVTNNTIKNITASTGRPMVWIRDSLNVVFAGNSLKDSATAYSGLGIANSPPGSLPSSLASCSGNTFANAGQQAISLALPTYISAAGTYNCASNTFDGVDTSGSPSAAQLAAIEDKVHHVLDDATLGLVIFRTNTTVATIHNRGIQVAINTASSGWAVAVGPGTYSEALTIGKSLTLVGDPGDPLVAGANPDPNTAPILDGTGLPGTPTAVAVNAGVSNVTISGFAVQNYYAGVSATDTSHLDVNNNTFVNVAYFTPSGCNNSNAVSVKGTGTNVLLAVRIAYNTVSNPNPYPGDAIYLQVVGSSSFNALVITNNVISNRNGGIVAKVSASGFFTDITVADNQYTLNASTGCSGSNAGVYLSNLQGNSHIERNTVNTVNSSAFSGIALFGTSNNGNLYLQGNSLTGGGNPGIQFVDAHTSGGTAILIFENEVTGYDFGITFPNVSFSPVPVIHGNSIHDNKQIPPGINYSGPTVLDASGNWWGSNSPTTVRSSFNTSSVVDYSPWLNVSTDTSSAPGFQGDFSALWVDDDGPQTGGAGRIQEGVNQIAAGGTVHVLTGVYTGSLTISSAVTVRGYDLPDLNAGSGPAMVCTASGGVTFEGFDVATTGTVFQLGPACGLTAYANNIISFATGISTTGGSVNARHNWWGIYDVRPGGVDDDSWAFRLGAAVRRWADGAGSATLSDIGNGGTASLSGGTHTAVIVSEGRPTVVTDAPFGNGVSGHFDQMCSDFYDFFVVGGDSETWTLKVPVDDNADCNANTRDAKKVYWVTNFAECSPSNNAACWDRFSPGAIDIVGQNLRVSGLSVSDLGGTPFVAGDIGGMDPTAVTLVRFAAGSPAGSRAALGALALLCAAGGAALVLRRRRADDRA
jgi:nitrous oxidase accessory protein NosD